MSKPGRARKSAPQNRVKSFESAAREIEPGFPLVAAERERFDAIIVSRERDTWSPVDVFTASTIAQLEVEAKELREVYLAEGHTISDHNGKPIVNPAFTAYNTLQSNLNRLRRELGLTASQKGISGARQAKRNQQDMKAAEKVTGMSTLIARPNGKN